MIKNEYYITFSIDTVKILNEHKIVHKKISNDNKARKRGWYFLISEIKENFPEFFSFVENARGNRQQHNRKRKIKQRKHKHHSVPIKNKFYNEAEAKKNVIRLNPIRIIKKGLDESNP